jgi:short-subunit dehydrogenase
MRIDNKTWVGTGGGSGWGRELTWNLLNKGGGVAIVGRKESTLQETLALAGAHKNRVSLHAIDISDQTAVETLPEQIKTYHDEIDGLINNAGIIQPFVRLNELDYAAIDRVIKINFYGTVYMVKTFLPVLLNRPEAHIINISSMGGFLPVPGQTIYGASKAAVKLLTEGLNSELQDTQVRVTLVLPGAMKTHIAENSGINLEIKGDKQTLEYKSMAADKAAGMIVKAIEANRSRLLVGSDARLMDKLYRLSPERAARLIYKQMRALLGS